MTLAAIPFILFLAALGLALLAAEHYPARISGAAVWCFITWAFIA